MSTEPALTALARRAWRRLPAGVRRRLRPLRRRLDTTRRRVGARLTNTRSATPDARGRASDAQGTVSDAVGSGSPRIEVVARRRPVRSRRPRALRVSGVLDTFSASTFGPDMDLDASFGPDTWRDALDAHAPHLLLVESAWQGNGGTWQYQVGSYAYPTSVGLPHLSALVEACRRDGVPTVFWNKEDPVHFDKFKEAAALFDVVLTSDADRIDAYRALPGLRAEVVDALPFAAQPALHHPVGAPDPREPHPVFAGTFYRNRHHDRQVQLEMLLDAARPFGLVVFDRMGGVKTETAGFPDRFDPHVQGGLPYDEMVAAYRRYRVFLNTNSVTASPTMFSRRVFELLASGTPVVSTPSVGMEAMLGSVVRTVRTAEEAAAALTELLGDDEAWQAASRAGIALVHDGHTVAHRVAALARAAGIDLDPDADHALTIVLSDPSVAVEAVVAALPGPLRDVEVRRVEPADDRSTALAAAAATVTTPWVALTDGSVAGLDQLAALLPARRYAAAEAIGVGGDRHDVYVDRLATGAPVLVRPAAVPAWLTAAAADTPEAQRRALRDGGVRAFAAPAVTGPATGPGGAERGRTAPPGPDR